MSLNKLLRTRKGLIPEFWIVVGEIVAVNGSLACPSIHIVHTDQMYVFFCSDLPLHNVQTSLRHLHKSHGYYTYIVSTVFVIRQIIRLLVVVVVDRLLPVYNIIMLNTIF